MTTWLTPPQVADKLGLTRQQVHKYLKAGRIPSRAVEINGRVVARLIKLSDAKRPEPLKSGPKPKPKVVYRKTPKKSQIRKA